MVLLPSGVAHAESSVRPRGYPWLYPFAVKPKPRNGNPVSAGEGRSSTLGKQLMESTHIVSLRRRFPRLLPEGPPRPAGSSPASYPSGGSCQLATDCRRPPGGRRELRSHSLAELWRRPRRSVSKTRRHGPDPSRVTDSSLAASSGTSRHHSQDWSNPQLARRRRLRERPAVERKRCRPPLAAYPTPSSVGRPTSGSRLREAGTG